MSEKMSVKKQKNFQPVTGQGEQPPSFTFIRKMEIMQKETFRQESAVRP